MRTSSLGTCESQNVKENVEKFIEFFDSDKKVLWSFSISDNTSGPARTLELVRGALFHLEAISDDKIEEHDATEIWEILEQLRDLHWILEEQLKEEQKQPNKSLSDYEEEKDQ